MNGWKYIVHIGPADMPTPIVFPPWLQHKDVAAKMGVQPRSAGFLSIEGKTIKPVGFSDSLNLKPHPEDAEVFNL